MSDAAARDRIVKFGKSIFDRGLTAGSTGNISVKTDDGFLMTPTGSSLGDLDPARLSKIGVDGRHVGGDAPTMESFLHIAMFGERPRAGAVVHLHSTHSAAVSCMADLDPKNIMPPLTAYYVMRVGILPLVPYFAPGDLDLAKAVKELASMHHAVMLANHGPVVAGATLEDAVYATEELEETAKLYLLLRDIRTRPLTAEQVEELRKRFPVKG
jgi:ribulose-5-phosphate 4-epimerase/fuculose-1-phosphate aldolase